MERGSKGTVPSARRSERRASERRPVAWTARYGRLHALGVVDVGVGGLRLESDRALGFGAGDLRLGSAVSGLAMAFEVELLWSRLVGTERGPYGEILPRFQHGLRVRTGSLGRWRRLVRTSSLTVP